MFRSHLWPIVACVALSSLGCNTVLTLPPAALDGGTDTGAGDGAPDAEEPAPTGGTATRCTDEQLAENDHTETRADVVFANNQAIKQYTPACLTIKKGQKVTFAGNFFEHALEPKDGELVTPIPTVTDTGARLTVTFPKLGVYGFQCRSHPEQMFGAVRVIP